MFLAGLGLPSQLAKEDYATLLSAQARYVREQQDLEKEQWQNEVRSKW